MKMQKLVLQMWQWQCFSPQQFYLVWLANIILSVYINVPLKERHLDVIRAPFIKTKCVENVKQLEESFSLCSNGGGGASNY